MLGDVLRDQRIFYSKLGQSLFGQSQHKNVSFASEFHDMFLRETSRVKTFVAPLHTHECQEGCRRYHQSLGHTRHHKGINDVGESWQQLDRCMHWDPLMAHKNGNLSGRHGWNQHEMFGSIFMEKPPGLFDYSHAFWADDLYRSLLFIGSCKTGSKQLSSVQAKV